MTNQHTIIFVVLCRNQSGGLPVQPTTFNSVCHFDWSADEDKTYLVKSATPVCDMGM